MATGTVSLESIEAFLAVKRIAMVGVSRDPKHFSTALFKELVRRGYEVVPVNPQSEEVLGHRCFARVQDIQPPVEAALLMTPANATDAMVADCAEAGVGRIWMYRAGGSGGAVTPSSVAFCREHGIDVVPGECPFMFLPKNGVHGIHGFLWKLMGKYPKRQRAA